MNDIDYLRARYADQPLEVSIETQATCNAACTFCPYPMLERKHQRLSDEVLLKLLREMSHFQEPFFVSPFKVSDPLLDRRMSWFCQEIETLIPQAKIRLFTNGSMLTLPQVEWIGKLKRLDHLWISLNSTDPDEYEQIMGIRYDITRRRIDELHRQYLAGEFRQSVVISRVTDSMDGKRTMKDYHFENAVRNGWSGFKPFIIKRDGWLGHVSPSDPQIPQAPCARWFELSIMADGRAALCCMDGKGDFTTGSVLDSTLLEIYNQPTLRQWRMKKNSREGIEPCARCTY